MPADLAIVRILGMSWPDAVRSVGAEALGNTPDSCLQSVRDAARSVGDPMLRAADYQRWQDQHPGHPEVQAIRHHLGTWDQVLAQLAQVPR